MSFERAPARLMSRTPLLGAADSQRADDPGVDLKEVAAIIRRRWAWVLGTTLITLGLVLTYLLLASPVYTASVQILVDPLSQKSSDREAGSDGLPDGGIAFAESQLRILDSEKVLNRVVASENLAADPEFGSKSTSHIPQSMRKITSALGLTSDEVETSELQALRRLKAKVTTKRPEKGLVIDLFVSSHDREKSARLANAIADAYLSEQANARTEMAKRTAASLTARLADLREDMRQAEENVQRYKFQHNTLAAPNELVPLATSEAIAELRELERNAEASRALYQSFLVRSRQTAEEGTLDRSHARIISSAVPPMSRSWPPGLLLLGLSLVIGSGLGTGLALGRDIFDGKIYDQRQLRRVVDLPVLGTVPRLKRTNCVPNLTRKLLRGNYAPQISERIFLRLRDLLRIGESGRTSRILLVTSCGKQEGKSTVAFNLALAAARDGERVLLIDANLRTSDASPRFDIGTVKWWRRRQQKTPTGLAEVLKGSSPLNASLVLLQNSNLTLLPPGRAADVNARMDRLELLKKVFSKTQAYDLIIVDGGNILSDRFVRSLSTVAEELILVVRSGMTRPENLELAMGILGEASTRVRGIVLNDSKS